MAGPFKIQRVPRGLSELLSMFGGFTPTELEERSRLTLESMQFYGSQQLQSGFANNAAAAEGAAVSLTLHASLWTVLFGVQGAIAKTATMTALRGALTINRRTQFGPLLFSEELGPFGATETGTVSFGGYMPYPLLCPPGTTVSAIASIIGTDANANVSVFAEFGTLG